MTYTVDILHQGHTEVCVGDVLCSVFPRSTSTGKELDAETGYSYFGARYYGPATLAAWLSVDPMADKYPSISPYAYCAWNPLKLVDPEGREVYINGAQADQAVSQLQTSIMEISRSENGRLSVDLHDKTAQILPKKNVSYMMQS